MCYKYKYEVFPGDSAVAVEKNLPANIGNAKDSIQSLGQEIPKVETDLTPPSIPTWKL